MNDKTDKPQNAGDDLFDGNFTDDDIDAEIIDEFPDDEWDDTFEDTQAEPTEDSTRTVKSTRRRSFMSGKILYIIVAVFVIGAGVALFLHSGDKKENNFPAIQETPIQIDELADTSDLPPMPAPISSADENMAAPEPVADGVPDVAVIEDPALEIPKVPAVPPDKQLSQVDMAPATSHVQAPAPTAADKPVPALPAQMPIPVPNNTAELAALTAEKDSEAAEKLAAARKEWETQFNAMQTDLTKKLEIAEAALKKVRNQAEESDNQIKSLKDENQSLKAQIKTLKETPKAKPASPPPPPKEEVESAPAAATTPLTKSGDWVLRSAQPGRALISQIGADTMKSIKVGDTIPGLGRIVSIDIEDGLWIVRGTESQVSR